MSWATLINGLRVPGNVATHWDRADLLPSQIAKYLLIHHNWSDAAGRHRARVDQFWYEELILVRTCFSALKGKTQHVQRSQVEGWKLTPDRFSSILSSLFCFFSYYLGDQKQPETSMSKISHKRLFHTFMVPVLWYLALSILSIFLPIINLKILISSRCSSGPHLLLLNCLALWPEHNNHGLPSDPKTHFSPFILMRHGPISHYWCIIQTLALNVQECRAYRVKGNLRFGDIVILLRKHFH